MGARRERLSGSLALSVAVLLPLAPVWLDGAPGGPGSEVTAPGPPLTATAAAEARAAPRPVHLRVPAAGVDAAVVPVGLDEQGRLATPTAWDDVGWFAGGATPGEPGPAVLVGHVDSVDGAAVFFRLRQLAARDVIQVERHDGSKVAFVVERVERVAKDAFPTDAVYGPTDEPRLRLVTCMGPFDAETGTYAENLIVFATPAP